MYQLPEGMDIVFQSDPSAEPLVSVVVMFKNEADTIFLALDSLQIQETEFVFEVICLDGYSTDDSIGVVKRHPIAQKAPVTIVSMPRENHGMTVAQNVGANLARGEIILFMQADVRVRDPRAIARVARAFKDPGVVGTFFIGLGPGELFEQYDFWGKVFMSRYCGDRVERDFDTKFNGVRRETFFKVGQFDDRKLPLGGNDFEFETRLTQEGRIEPTDIEAEHVHAFKKRHTPWGMLKKYARNSEVAGVNAPIVWKNLRAQPGLLSMVVQQTALCVICLLSLLPWFWPYTLLLVLLMGVWWNRAAYRYIRDRRLVYVPFFSMAVMYVYAFYFMRGLLMGKTVYEFDNKMN